MRRAPRAWRNTAGVLVDETHCSVTTIGDIGCQCYDGCISRTSEHQVIKDPCGAFELPTHILLRTEVMRRQGRQPHLGYS